MEYYSNIFPPIYTNMIKVGELSGSLANALEQAIRYLDNNADLTKKVKGMIPYRKEKKILIIFKIMLIII